MAYLANEFKKAGLDVMFLKGATLALLYPVPEWRMFSDIDFYLYGRYDEGVMVLKEMGIETEEGFHHHSTSSYFDILLENHYDFIDRVNHKCNLLIDDELKKLAEKEGRDYPYTFDNKEIDNAYCMSPTMNAIFLIRHMSTHFASDTLSLRMLYDWALFLKMYGNTINWDKVLRVYELSGMAVFAGMIQEILLSKIHVEVADCPIIPVKGDTTDRIWMSIVHSLSLNPYRRYSLIHLWDEFMTFVRNRWKYKVVYPKESFLLLGLNYVWAYLKKSTTRLFV